MLVLLVTFGTVGCDQATKQMAVEYLRGAQATTHLRGLVELRYAENSGGFLSLGAFTSDVTRFALFTLGVGALLLAMFATVVLSRKLGVWERLALVALVAGGVSNWIDRLANDGRVVDFIILHAGPLRTGVFNVADVVIMAAIPLWLANTRSRRKERSQHSRTAGPSSL